jgi:gliding motility-associated-like protein
VVSVQLQKQISLYLTLLQQSIFRPIKPWPASLLQYNLPMLLWQTPELKLRGHGILEITAKALHKIPHTYTTPGYYSIYLAVTSSTGCKGAAQKTRYIRIVDGVKADFAYTLPSSCQPPYTVAYTNLTSGPGNLSYNWDLSTSTSTQLSPSGIYGAAGNYTVKLTATSDIGCSGVIQKIVPITGAVTSFKTVGNKDTVCLGTSVSFQSTASPAPVKVVWDFGDGTSFTGLVPPPKKYASPGIYTVTMNADFASCSSVATKTISVFALPTVDYYSANSNSFCKGPAPVVFQDLSPDVVTALWNFGDPGGTSTSTNPLVTHTYTSTGNFPVSLTITDSHGCSNSISRPNYVNILTPVASIGNIPSGLCKGQAFMPVFNGGTVDGIASYMWDFGDGMTSTSGNPSHSYAANGTYTVKLTIVTNGGCTATATANSTIQVSDPPVVDFSEDLSVVCHSSVVTFTNLSTPAGSKPVLWSFGDGDTSSQQNPQHKYADSGLFNVQLKVTSNGCSDSLTKTGFVHVLPPVANFGYKTMDCINRTNVSFIDSSATNPADGPISYLWSFNDPGNTTSTAVGDTSFAYPPLNGHDTSYAVQLIVNNGACADTVTKKILLFNERATITAIADTFCKLSNIIFSTANTPAYFSKFEWILDGAAPVTGNTFTVFTGVTGNHTIQLIATDINGCISDTTKTFNITGPTALFGVQNNGGCKGNTITFTDSSTSTAIINQWIFDFGDGVIQSFLTGPPFTHLYTDTGTFKVKLTISDNRGCGDIYSLTNGVIISKPTAYFHADTTTYCPNTPLQFTDSSFGQGLQYAWNFGDGNTANTKNPMHQYAGSDSVYTVKLVVTDTVGCMDSIAHYNYINIKRPKALFNVLDTASLCIPLETKFYFLGKDYTSYSWDFGDGSGPSSLDSPNHFYNGYGKYIAKLYVTGFGGCVDSASINITITDPAANTSFTFSPITACNNLTAHFSVTTPYGSAFTMYFGDNTNTTLQVDTFSHFYSLPNLYAPYIFLQDSVGCQVIIGGRGNVDVKGAIPIFGTDKNKFCDSGTVYFTDYSQQANDAIVTSTWNFGDNSTPVVLPGDAIHSYTTTGLFAPTLTVTTAAGCTQTYTDTVRVLATPHPVIASAAGVCKNSPLDFAGSLLAPPDTAITWSWGFEGQTASTQNITVKYTDTGLHHISLQAANSLGCKGDTSKDITVYSLPTINVTGDTSIVSGGIGITIPLTYSANAVAFNWTPSTYLSCTDCANPFANPQFTTTYKVTVTDANGCVSSRNLTLVVVCNNKNFFIPNTFSPNNDGSNDRFYPRGTGLNLIQALRIFNRWGELVFEKRNFPANDALSGWDGTYKGKPAATDTYIYMIDIICENANIITYKGNVTLIR